MSDTRRAVGKNATLLSREYVYESAEGFDVEAREAYEVVQRRVLYDDVQLVTLHREYGAAYLIITGVISLFFVTIAGFILTLGAEAWIAALVVLATGSPAFFAFFLRLFLGVDVVTIFGRRSKASIRFRVRKRRAREVYGQICATVRRAQQAGARVEEAPVSPET
jgi:hypothetical protein